MSSTNLVCPDCHNHYPLSANFTQCPVCKVDLTTPGEPKIINKRKAGDIKNNSGAVIVGDGNIVNEQSKSSGAKYNFLSKGTTSALNLGKPALGWLTLSSFLVYLLNFSGSVASILSIFGVQYKVDFQEIIKFDKIKLQPWFSDIRMIIYVVLTVATVYYMCVWINKVRKANNGEYVHIDGSTFCKKEQGILQKGLLGGKCPIETCPGYLTVTVAPDNEDKVEFIGICSEARGLHRFEISLKNLKGERLTKLNKKVKQSNNQSRK